MTRYRKESEYIWSPGPYQEVLDKWHKEMMADHPALQPDGTEVSQEKSNKDAENAYCATCTRYDIMGYGQMCPCEHYPHKEYKK